MNSKERVLATMEHIQPDRVPVDVCFAPELQEKLQNHLGLDEQGLFDWAGQDFVGVGPVFKNPATDIRYADPTIEITKEGYYLDIFRVPFRQTKTEFQTYMEPAGRPPLKGYNTIKELEDFPWPTVDMWDYSNIPAELESNSHKAIWGHSRGFFEISHFMRGMEDFMMDLALNPEHACSLMDHIADYLLERTRRILEIGKGKFDVFEYNDDVASQLDLFISPDMWRQYVKPRMAKFCDLIHSHKTKVRYHCCGSVRSIIPDLIEIGVDILNPVQPLAANMDPFELKREFGDRLVLNGGMDIQDLLPNSSAERVRSHTRKMIDIVGKDGGFILSGSHVIQADVPVENVIAMLDEAKR